MRLVWFASQVHTSLVPIHMLTRKKKKGKKTFGSPILVEIESTGRAKVFFFLRSPPHQSSCCGEKDGWMDGWSLVCFIRATLREFVCRKRKRQIAPLFNKQMCGGEHRYGLTHI